MGDLLAGGGAAADENAANTTLDEADLSNSSFVKLLDSSTSSAAAGTRVLAFKNKAPAPKDEYQNSLKVLYSQSNGKKGDVVKPTRHISSTPVRILDAPDLLDDYYLNLLSWGPTNVLAVALSQCVYLWDASTGGIKELMNVDGGDPNDYVSSVSWIQQGGSHLAIGTGSNTVQLWDVQAGKKVRTMHGHSARVGALAWNNHVLSSGSRDTTVLNHDVRIQNHVIGKMASHTQEVCGLAWSPDGAFLASGANDNTLCIWDAATSQQSMNAQPRHVLTEHQAAVKALAWSPHERNLLASGGGTADRCIKFWNAASGTMLNSVDTGSQVCALQWSPLEKELLSSHGYAENQLCLWKYPTMAKIKELKGHTSRVLHMAISPDGGTVCSGAADETLRFWNVFASEGKKKGDVGGGASALSRASGSLKIR
jgi:cell division cycle protein 20 (cofactor of APC complex)